MKQIKVHGMLVWDDLHFQREIPPQIDAEEAGAALVAACVHHPDRAEALAKALAEPTEPKPYHPPVWADK